MQWVCIKKKKLTNLDVMDDSFRRIYYVKYVDDFIIVFIWLLKEVTEIYIKVSNKLK